MVSRRASWGTRSPHGPGLGERESLSVVGSSRHSGVWEAARRFSCRRSRDRPRRGRSRCGRVPPGWADRSFVGSGLGVRRSLSVMGSSGSSGPGEVGRRSVGRPRSGVPRCGRVARVRGGWSFEGPGSGASLSVMGSSTTSEPCCAASGDSRGSAEEGAGERPGVPGGPPSGRGVGASPGRPSNRAPSSGTAPTVRGERPSRGSETGPRACISVTRPSRRPGGSSSWPGDGR